MLPPLQEPLSLKFRSQVPQDKILAIIKGSVSNQTFCKGFRMKEKVEKHCSRLIIHVVTFEVTQLITLHYAFALCFRMRQSFGAQDEELIYCALHGFLMTAWLSHLITNI